MTSSLALERCRSDARRPRRKATSARLCALTCLAAGCFVTSPCIAGTASGSLTASTYINSDTPNNNNGGCAIIVIGQDNVWEGPPAASLRGLVQLSLPTNLAGRVNVTAVTLSMTLVGLPDGRGVGMPATYILEPNLQPWLEGTHCAAQSAPTYYVGTACGATPGATWSTSDCMTPWTGGGSVGAVSGFASSVGVGVGSRLTWSSQSGAPGLITNIQGWIDGATRLNNGWRIRSSSEGFTAQGTETAQAFSKTASLLVTFTCKAGYLDTGSMCTTCTPAAEMACGIASGNACADWGPPSTLYSCACRSPYILGTGADGNAACVIGSGDGGATDMGMDGGGTGDSGVAMDSSGAAMDSSAATESAVPMESGAMASDAATDSDVQTGALANVDSGSLTDSEVAGTDSSTVSIDGSAESGAGGVNTSSDVPRQSGGCGCLVARSQSAHWGDAALAAVLLMVAVRRRRRLAERIRPD